MRLLVVVFGFTWVDGGLSFCLKGLMGLPLLAGVSDVVSHVS